VKYADLRIVLIAMKSGIRREGHKADGSISIQGLSGKLRLHPANRTLGLTDQQASFTYVYIAGSTPAAFFEPSLARRQGM
jgi:hypothetical protein